MCKIHKEFRPSGNRLDRLVRLCIFRRKKYVQVYYFSRGRTNKIQSYFSVLFHQYTTLSMYLCHLVTVVKLYYSMAFEAQHFIHDKFTNNTQRTIQMEGCMWHRDGPLGRRVAVEIGQQVEACHRDGVMGRRVASEWSNGQKSGIEIGQWVEGWHRDGQMGSDLDCHRTKRT